MQHKDQANYYEFTGPQVAEKAANMLAGMVQGIEFDKKLRDGERDVLLNWCDQYKDRSHRSPFNSLIPHVRDLASSELPDEELVEDIVWVCEKFTSTNPYYSQVTQDMQRLHGLLGGIAADGVIEKSELNKLSDWMDDHDYLRGAWPFDEIESMILSVLSDGKIDDEEHKFLMAFFSEFLGRINMTALMEINDDLIQLGVCATCPDIQFDGKRFCLSGASSRGTKKVIESKIAALGGVPRDNVVKDLDYLVVGDEGNTCWAFSCYGRKVEKAANMRREGHRVLIVHEFDFWDAVEDQDVS